jgi:hypothetical protein
VLDRLTAVVTDRLDEPLDEDLDRNARGRADLAAVLEWTAKRDRVFASELAGLRAQLESLGVRPTVRNINGRAVVVGDNGIAVGGDYYDGRHTIIADDNPMEWAVRGSGIGRALVVVGILAAITGFAGWMYVIFSAAAGRTNPFAVKLPLGLPLGPTAFGVAAAGALLAMLGAAICRARAHPVR